MTGQDAVNSAKAFNDALELDGMIMTKLDCDARGGAALSVKRSPACRSSSSAVGEKLDELEEFHPERIAGRILGMGDVVSLVEQAQESVDRRRRQAAGEVAKGKFHLDDFRNADRQMKKMGPIRKVMGMIPGMGQFRDQARGGSMPRGRSSSHPGDHPQQ